ncbi:hypothetical protein MMYC01_201353 [Madurella mycetomatis]|uniref:Uncharacterized protein n=1 Tax=Madurella mycetomatis TaxID=100816 RepID=A0A175WFX6_9PEZI|nr:hypothetical protein MMYC01_201353 [Madurella mycetomatis]
MGSSQSRSAGTASSATPGAAGSLRRLLGHGCGKAVDYAPHENTPSQEVKVNGQPSTRGGDIDIGEVTENALAAKAVTQVRSGGDVQVTIHQNLTVSNNITGSNGLSQSRPQDFNITVTMSDNLKCIGGSTGNVCTVRCRNTALAGPFGGCFAVQQTDTEPHVNMPQGVETVDTLELLDHECAAEVNAILGGIPAATATVAAGDATPTGEAEAGEDDNGDDGGNGRGAGRARSGRNGNGFGGGNNKRDGRLLEWANKRVILSGADGETSS